MAETATVERMDEAGIEEDFLDRLGEVGWDVYWDDPPRGGAARLDEGYDREPNETVYWNLLEDKLVELNDFISSGNVDDVISSLKRDLRGEHLIELNRTVYGILRGGKKVSVKGEDGSTEYKYADLIDYQNPSNNSLIATNQFRVHRTHEAVPDVVLLVNGIPIVIGELKSLAQDADWVDAYNDLKDYETQVPDLFVPVLFNVAADENRFRCGAVGIGQDYYTPWRKDREGQTGEEVADAVEDLLAPTTVLDVLKHFVFYADDAGGDKKIIPRYMQYRASHRIMHRLASSEHDRGLYWHTQGSGKSYTMLFTAVNLLRREGEERVLPNPQIIIVVDQDKLRTQMSDDLQAVGIEQHTVAKSINHLQRLIEDGKSEIVLTTIQMFQDVDPDSQGNPNTVLMIDEAHRFMEKDLGNKLEAALPDAYHFAFTGTPVRERERDTFDNYCPPGELYHDRYSIRDGLRDEVILPVHFDVRHVMEWSVDQAGMDAEFDALTGDMSLEEKDRRIREILSGSDLAELRPRVSKVAETISDHFEEVEKNGWKGMVVTPTRKAAALYGEELMKFRDPEEIEVLISESRDEGPHEPFMDKFYTSDAQKDRIVKEYKQEESPKLLVVCNMLLTGFDAPILKTMYLDRYLTNHTLLQAIARTNRPAPGKVNGEIVDFAGAFKELDKALDYGKEVRDSAAFNRDELLDEFEDLLDETMQLFEGIEKTNSPDTLNECLLLLTKEGSKRKLFESRFGRLQDLYESLSPDERLAQPEVEDPYRWLNQVWVAYQRRFNRKESADRDLKAKTKEILERSIDITEINDEFPVYKISEEHLEQLQNMEPAARATEIAHAVTEQIEDNIKRNPLYEHLSDRLHDLLKKWERGEMPDSVFADKAEEIEREAIDVEQAPERREMTSAEYAIEQLVEEDYPSHIKEEGDAERIARVIGEAVRDQVDTSYEGWKENPQALREIRQVIIQTIVKDLERPGLYHAEGFVDAVRDYLIENMEEG